MKLTVVPVVAAVLVVPVIADDTLVACPAVGALGLMRLVVVVVPFEAFGLYVLFDLGLLVVPDLLETSIDQSSMSITFSAGLSVLRDASNFDYRRRRAYL